MGAPRMPSTETMNDVNHAKFLFAKNALHAAIDELLAKDMDLLVSGAHEQAICHRLAVYLEPRTPLNVDCEYNRNMMRAKTLIGKRRFRPDIIIHRRLSNDENLLVVETKSRARKSVSDAQRLSELTAELSDYGYSGGAFIIFHNRPTTMLKRGVLPVTIDWYFASTLQAEPTKTEGRISGRLMDELRSFTCNR
jgi:hypothetical protein